MGPMGLVSRVLHLSILQDLSGLDSCMSKPDAAGLAMAPITTHIVGRICPRRPGLRCHRLSLRNKRPSSPLTGTAPDRPRDCSSSTTPGAHGFAMGFNYNGKLAPRSFF